MPDSEKWLPARLIPTAGIRGQEEQERRATSALLAVMTAVPEFARAILDHMGAARGSVSTFCEVPLKAPDGKASRPDGAVVIERGKTRWSCLVEVKTGKAELRTEQMAGYIGMARAHGFDGVLSISNQITSRPDELPYEVDGRKVGKLIVRHLSWWQILTEAVVQHEHRGISDPDQQWILGELIAYLSHDASGASGLSDMGPEWVSVREGVAAGILKPQDVGALAVAERWTQFVRYLCLSLSQALGADVKVQGRLDAVSVAKRLCREGILGATIRVPGAAGPLALDADLRAARFSTAVAVDAPQDKQRPAAAINWLLRQVDPSISGQVIEVAFANAKETVVRTLPEIESPADLLSPSDRKRMPRKFIVSVSRKMGARRAGGRGFIAEAESQVVDFYREVVQGIKVWRPAAPKMPPQVQEATVTDGAPEQPLEHAAVARVSQVGAHQEPVPSSGASD
jgi:hypothetical protein